ncbi:hypothetical protein [Asticcacaulis machinosus]|uniref:TonB C-terminal domain-containing protein n=1 Tax=Asticcacaulis machinosus TaxID=2984211 RepID=A0ABT5HIB3_9CAUL|nr:hypothetical protein [Asticcacaulis machinosus]MDC7675339.1 hypothetical protein [Asticcacaulis machinosus]
MINRSVGRSATLVAGFIISLITAGVGEAQDDTVASVNPASAPSEQPLVWARYPSGTEALKHYPAKALDAEQSGVARIECDFDAPPSGETTSSIKSCRTLEEYPAGMGFGKATEDIIHRYGRVRTQYGESLQAGRITLRYRWVLQGGPLRPESETIGFKAGTNADDYYPKGSQKSAHIKLRCAYKVAESETVGDITHCTVTSEKPKGTGLGASAQTLFEDRGLVVFGGPTLLIPSEGEISFGFDWKPPAAK